MNNIKETNGTYKERQRKKIKQFIKISKYDALPAVLAGSTLSSLFMKVYTTQGMYDTLIFGGVCGLAFICAVNAAITGIKLSKEEKQKLAEDLQINNDMEEGMHL